jgi:sugar/nucleoside kinase (ribokinase family)
MKKYHVYGMGNALVDMEVEVSQDYLEKMGVEKGVMTLVDQERQDELLSKIDGQQHRRTCGGSAANTIIAVSQLGGRSYYSCKVASDEAGDFYFEDLLSHGVQTNLHGNREEGVSGKCMVFVTPDADRTMNTYLGITADFSESEISWDELKDSEYLYIEGYLVTNPNGVIAAEKACQFAKENGVKTALTFSDPGIVAHFEEGFHRMIGSGVDLLFCNEAEALSFSGKNNIEEALDVLKKFGKTIAITLGKKGALLWDGQKQIEVITQKVDAVDTNGAGDLFAGSFLYAITHGHKFGEAGKLACAAASKLVTQFGARLDDGQAKSVYTEIFE